MGIEFLIQGLWVVQAIAALVLAWRTALDNRWFAAAGTIVGLSIGLAPFFLLQGQGPAVWKPAVLIVLVSTFVLIIVYGMAMQWKLFIATLLMLAIPLAYRLLAFQKFPPSSNVFFGLLAFLGEVAFLLGPIACALASREILDWADRLVATRRSA